MSDNSNNISEKFAAQFDPNSEHYHGGGDTTPVPFGDEKKFPEGLTEFPENPVNNEETDYGEEYNKIMTLRNNIGALKKDLTALPGRARRVLSQTEFQKLTKPLTKQIGAIEEQCKSIDGVSFEFNDLKTFLSEPPASEQAQKEFPLKAKQHGQQLFRHMKTLLEKLKAIKKEKASN